jgi:nickel-dependent lactate racemase
MKVRLDFGREGMEVELPQARVKHILGLTPAPPLDDPDAAIRAALERPIGTEPLRTLARGKKDACLVICDITRPVPNEAIVKAMLPVLNECGIPPERVTVLIATGTHRPSTNEEKLAMLGTEILAAGVKVVDHVCTDPQTNRFVGVSPSGIDVFLDTHWLDADLKITIGLIEPHFMAGYSGGRKLVMPGVASLSTIQAWHSPQFLEHEKAVNGVTLGNPVHEENTAIAAMAPADLICDVTIDEKRRTTGVFCGHWIEAWRAGCTFVAEQVRPPIPDYVDIVVTSGGGYPLDATFYQVIKGIVAAYPIARPGGTVIIAAELSEGVGSHHFAGTLQGWPDRQALVAAMSTPDWKPIPEQWQPEMLARATRERRVIVVVPGDVRRAELAACHVEVAKSVEEALESLGGEGTIAATPKGPYVTPYVAL